MAKTYNFTTTDTTFSILENGTTVGTWDKEDNKSVIESTIDIDLGSSLTISLKNPYYSMTINPTDTIQIDGVEHEDGLEEFANVLVSDVVSLAGGGPVEVTVYQLKTVLTDAQIKALPTTPVQLVPAPGADKLLVFMRAIACLKASAGGYVTDGGGSYINIILNSFDTSNYSPASWIENQDDVSQLFTPTVYPGSGSFASSMIEATNKLTSIMVNQPIYLAGYNNAEAAFSGGHASNTLEVTVFYSIVEL